MSLDASPPPAPLQPPITLPLQLTSFIGREREIGAVSRLLVTTRLLTLTGAGGCGKTRLALKVAEQVTGDYSDGVWFSGLAALADPALVPQAVAAAVGAVEVPGADVTDTLLSHLRGRTALLVLDNCEHVVDAAAELVNALLRGSAGLRVLATSREALGIAGETTWRVPSLDLPPHPVKGESPANLVEYEAIRLFVERARAARPDFAITHENATALAETCRGLDGIPLALELAAARVRVFSVEQIAARLDDRFRLLTAGERMALPRQQTLRATVDWSYALLSEPERVLLRRLSVFAGGWTFEAAEAVAAGDGIQAYAVLELLGQLVDKSLVVADEQRGAARYRLLETIRQYAEDRLVEADDVERSRARHLAYFLQLAEEAEPGLLGPEGGTILARLSSDDGNFRRALDSALAEPPDDEAALRLSGALGHYWWLRAHHDEAAHRLERSLARSAKRSPARVKALISAGWLATHRRELALAREMLSEGLAIARELDDRWSAALALHHLGRIAYFEGDAPAARSLGEESLAIAEETADDWLIAWPLHLLGLAAYMAADYPGARAFYQRSLALRRDLGFGEGIGILLVLLGIVAIRERNLAEAYALHREALPFLLAVHEGWGLMMPLANISRIAAAAGQPIKAVRLGAAATSLSETYLTPLIPLSEVLLAESLQLAKQSLTEPAFAAAWAEGRAMSLQEGLAEALALEDVVQPVPLPAPGMHRDGPFGKLTAAEIQVLRLLAGGHTSKEIAGELVVAVSTVDRHITHIYEKLGVRNRAAATAFALTHGLIGTSAGPD